MLKSSFFHLAFNFVILSGSIFSGGSAIGKDQPKQNRSDEIKRMETKFKDCCASITKYQISASEIIKQGKPIDPKQKIVYIDVRDENEQDISMIPGAIKSSDVDFDKLDPKIKYVAYCTIGYRSGKFVNKLRKKGLQAFNLVGGIYGWTFEDGEIHSKQSKPTKSVHVYSSDWNYLRSDYKAVK